MPSEPLEKCFSEARLNGLTLRDRLIKAATFEGKSAGGVPSEALVRLHERIGQGGIGLTTRAYCAAESDGRINENMMYMAGSGQIASEFGLVAILLLGSGSVESLESFYTSHTRPCITVITSAGWPRPWHAARPGTLGVG